MVNSEVQLFTLTSNDNGNTLGVLINLIKYPKLKISYFLKNVANRIRSSILGKCFIITLTSFEEFCDLHAGIIQLKKLNPLLLKLYFALRIGVRPPNK